MDASDEKPFDHAWFLTTAGLDPAEAISVGIAAFPVQVADTPGISRDGLTLRNQGMGILDGRHVFGAAAE